MSTLLGAASSGTYGVDLVEVLSSASPMVQAVLVLLVIMSLVCWFIIGYKWRYFRRVEAANRRFREAFWNSNELEGVLETAQSEICSPSARVFREGYAELKRIRARGESSTGAGIGTAFENIERTVRRTMQEEVTKFERMVPFLATTGTTAPFIGLFGTVWGIVEAFDRIPKQGGVILDKVAGPMAHALIATAVGLLAAIPAVMAYNWFVRKIRLSAAEVDGFSSEFLNVIRRRMG